MLTNTQVGYKKSMMNLFQTPRTAIYRNTVPANYNYYKVLKYKTGN